MVGVGGRSRGCKTCRRARVKCDETRPICNRCTRLKRRCEGCNPYPVFVDGLTLLEIPPEHEDSDIPNPREDASLAVTSIPTTLVMDTDGIFLAYLMMNIATEPRMGNKSSNISRWVIAATQPNSQTYTSQLAVGALAAAYYGKLHSRQQAINRGTILYTQVLREIRKDLCDRGRALDTATLANTLILATYEFITFKDTTGWLTHCLGVGQLVNVRGPFRHQTGLGKESFQSTRGVIALAHLVSNKRCFLEEIAWKMVPWANDPDSKDAVDYLLDVFCDVPGILEDMKLLQDTPIAQGDLSTIWRAVGLRLKSCMESLYRWRAKWELDFSNTCYPIGLDSLRDLNAIWLEIYPLSTAIFFTKPTHATGLCLYNSMLVLFHRALAKLPSSIVPIATPNVPPLGNYCRGSNPRVLLAPGDGLVEDIICEICRIVYYQLLSYSTSSAALRLMFPLQVAYRNIDPRSDIAEWLSKVISHIADVHGFGAVKFAQNSTRVTIVV